MTTIPLILAVSAISLLVTYQAHNLSESGSTALERNMLAAKKAELLNYLKLARASIRHIYINASADDVAAQAKVKQILNDMTYGVDGFFFVYDYKGNSLVDPKQPQQVGYNWWHYRDIRGSPVIRILITKALEGGGFHRYIGRKPSTGQLVEKISYATVLDKWDWMLGTGLYIDDVAEQVAAMQADLSAHIRQTSWMILGVTLIALVVVFLVGLLINLHERRTADAKLKELTHRVIETQEEERGRVARELHDGISQVLISVKYALELALMKSKSGSSDVAPTIEKGLTNLFAAIREVRRISKDLRPSTLDDLGLSPALKSLAGDFSERTGIRVDIETSPIRELLNGDEKTTLYRIAQEALTNIERHATASHVTIDLSSTTASVTLTINDDGGGFDIDAITQNGNIQAGIGLRNMRERIEYHSGKLILQSTKNGTTVRVVLPYSNAARNEQEEEPCPDPEFAS